MIFANPTGLNGVSWHHLFTNSEKAQLLSSIDAKSRKAGYFPGKYHATDYNYWQA